MTDSAVAEGLARRLWPDWDRLPKDQANQARRSAVAAVDGQGEEVIAAVDGALAHLDEPSYSKRLLRLAEHAGEAVPGVLGRLTLKGDPSRWTNHVVDARNDFAHRFDRGWLDDDSTDRYLAVSSSLRWLLTATLLLETGLSSETLAAHLRDHQRYTLFLEQARQWLPAVYAPGPK